MLSSLGAGLAVAARDAPARPASRPDALRGSASFHGLPPDPRFGLDGTDDERMGRVAMQALARDKRPYSLYVIRNSRPGPDLETVDRSTLKGIGDLYQLYVIARRDGFDFNLTWIMASFTEKLKQPLETVDINRLYRIGRTAAESGTAWSKYPPGYNPAPLRPIIRAAVR
ncbi:MAG TPA: hypothetical protein VLA02_09535 [Reyranella sp.]|nr:hypothetical protein [Reyranella sp.]